MLEKITGSTHHLVYESLEELETLGVQRCQRFNAHAYHSASESQGDARTWYGTREEPREKIQHGWPELLETLRTMSERLELSDEVTPHLAILRRRKRVRGDSGDELDMPRVYSGQLATAWTAPRRRMAPRYSERFATLVINVSCSCHTSFDSTIWRAAIALKVCNMLQAAGRTVEIYVANPVNPYGRFACRVKTYGQPLVVERLVAMSSAAFLRTYGFIMIGSANTRVDAGLGYPTDGIPVQILERREAGELVIDIGQIFTEAAAKSEVLKIQNQLKESVNV